MHHFLGLFISTSLVLHSTAIAQSSLSSQELRLIANAFEKIQAEYVNSVAEPVFATGCRDGILQIVNEKSSHPYSEQELPTFDNRNLQQATNLIPYFLEKLPGAVTPRDLVDGCLSTVFKALDPHSAYLDPKTFRELRKGAGPFVGIGLEMGLEEGYLKVVTPLENAPSHRAGLLPGDLITRIDGVSVKGHSLEDLARMLRGEPNTIVNLVVARRNADKLLIFNIVRQEIRVKTVSSKVLDEKYVYVRIRQINATTLEELGKELRTTAQQNPNGLAGLVLDLRNNTGGILPGAVGVAAAFLPSSTKILSVKGRMPDANADFYNRPEFYKTGSGPDPLRDLPAAAKTMPMLVLVNQKTASGAEMIAASLQDHRRARIVGEQTLGYGTVQTVRLLDQETAIKLTTAKLIRPDGKELDKAGVKPDYLVMAKTASHIEFGTKDDRELMEALQNLDKP